MRKYAANPKGIRGRILLKKLRTGQDGIIAAGLANIEISPESEILDIGCGDGFNIYNLLNKYQNIKATGIDISPLSCKKAKKLNKTYIKDNRCKIFNLDIKELNFANKKFDLITAFRTVRFWTDLNTCAKNIFECLNDKGVFLITDHGGYDLDSLFKAL